MNKFDANELTRQRDTQISAMQDECFIQDYTPTKDHGEEVPDWTQRTTPTFFGLQEKGSREMQMPDKTIIWHDATGRFPLGTGINERDRIVVYNRYSQPDVEVIYAVAGEPRQGPSAVLVYLIRVEPGPNR